MIFYSPYNQTLMGVSRLQTRSPLPLHRCSNYCPGNEKTLPTWYSGIPTSGKTQEYSISCWKLIYLLCTFYKSVWNFILIPIVYSYLARSDTLPAYTWRPARPIISAWPSTRALSMTVEWLIPQIPCARFSMLVSIAIMGTGWQADKWSLINSTRYVLNQDSVYCVWCWITLSTRPNKFQGI